MKLRDLRITQNGCEDLAELLELMQENPDQIVQCRGRRADPAQKWMNMIENDSIDFESYVYRLKPSVTYEYRLMYQIQTGSVDDLEICIGRMSDSEEQCLKIHPNPEENRPFKNMVVLRYIKTDGELELTEFKRC